jgi:AraC-like DNA-binding protein
MVGVHFKPGGAFGFLNLSPAELHNRHVALDDLWGPKAVELQDRLNECNTPAAKFRILEHSLLTSPTLRLTRDPAIGFALNRFRGSAQIPAVAQVTNQVGLSPKRFIRLFTEQVGMTPKLFCRVERFQRVLRRLEGRKYVNWTDLALSSGYYDQAHFNNEFRTFSGLCPTTYMLFRGDHFNHVPLAD